MSMRISIDDMGSELSVTLSVSGGYNPDVLDDLRARATASYKEVLADKIAIGSAAEAVTEGVTDE